MPTLSVFNSISLDGYFTDAHGDMSWAHRGPDEEFDAFTNANASGGGELVFGRVTYELMAGFWPTVDAFDAMPEVARQMNDLPKVVFSRTLDEASWANTELIGDDLIGAIRGRKAGSGPDMVVMGSGTVVAQLTDARLVDEYQVVLVPLVLGAGRTMFEGVREPLDLVLTESRTFGNGNVVMRFRPNG